MKNILKLNEEFSICERNGKIYLFDKKGEVKAIFDRIISIDKINKEMEVAVNIDGVYNNITLPNILSGSITLCGPYIDNEWYFKETYFDKDNGLTRETGDIPYESYKLITGNGLDFFGIVKTAQDYMNKLAKDEYQRQDIYPIMDGKTSYTI